STSFSVLAALCTPHRFLLFFPSRGPPRDLHSFPTRRSSDLASAQARRRDRGLAARAQVVRLPHHRRTRRPRHRARPADRHPPPGDRKSTRLNSSHVSISYAVFCLKKKKKKREQ